MNVLDYGHEDENTSSWYWEFVSYDDLDSLIQKMLGFTSLKSTADPGDHFEVTAWVPLTKLNPQFHLAVELFQLIILSTNDQDR
jgi:hypothetical protein